jgi:hypothetical protein
MGALRNERKLYEFAPIWFETDQVDAVSSKLVRQRDQAEANAKAQKEIDKERNKQLEDQKNTVEAKLRRENGPRANALRDRIHNLIQDLPKNAAEEAQRRTERRAVEMEHLFPQYLTWLNKRFGDRWETAAVTSDIDDFGALEWNGRPLDGMIVRTMVKQRNRIRGEIKTDCFLFGLVDDVEFSMWRDLFTVECEKSERLLTDWKVRRQFVSKWNWEQPVSGSIKTPNSVSSKP